MLKLSDSTKKTISLKGSEWNWLPVLFNQMKCNENYLSMGFTNINNLPYCVFCNRTFLNSIMVKTSFWDQHSELKAKEIEILNAGMVRTLNTKNCFITFQSGNEKVIQTSQAKLLDCVSKAYTIAQRPVKPYTVDIAECLLDGKSMKESTALPFSNNLEIYWFKHLTENKEWFNILSTELYFCLTNKWIQCSKTNFLCIHMASVPTNLSRRYSFMSMSE